MCAGYCVPRYGLGVLTKKNTKMRRRSLAPSLEFENEAHLGRISSSELLLFGPPGTSRHVQCFGSTFMCNLLYHTFYVLRFTSHVCVRFKLRIGS